MGSPNEEMRSKKREDNIPVREKGIHPNGGSNLADKLDGKII